MQLPLLTYPPSRFSEWLKKLRLAAAIASRKISSINAWIAGRVHVTQKIFSRLATATSIGLGFTLMQIGEWAFAIAVWFVVGPILFLKALAWEGSESIPVPATWQKRFALLLVIVGTTLLILITNLRKPESDPWTSIERLWHPRSVLVMKETVIGTYGPGVPFTSVIFELRNPPRDAVEKVDLRIEINDPSRSIQKFAQTPPERQDCKTEPVDTYPHPTVEIKSKDGKNGLTIPFDELINDHLRLIGSPKWKLYCERLSGQADLRFEMLIFGNAMNDVLAVTGNYELIPNRGSTVITVQNRIVITK